MSRALVLGGGGPVGIGWETGLIAGLAESGLDVAQADLIVGTSAGAIVGAQLALGRPPTALVAAQRKLAARERATGTPPSVPEATGSPMTRLQELAGEAPLSAESLREIGRWATKAWTASEAETLAGLGFIGRLGSGDWPERDFIATAIDAETGELVGWTPGSGVPFGLAVASSTVVPGRYAPITIGGRRYYDGGVASATNAHFAGGHDSVLIVSVTAAPGPDSARSRAALEREMAALRDAGSSVAAIVPDAGAIAAFGPDRMDASRREAALDQGYRQGLAEGPRLAQRWSSSSA